MYLLLTIVILVATALAKDFSVGQGGRLVSQKNYASFWGTEQNVNIRTPENITRIAVIDNRKYKDGEAAIVGGGIGFKHVTITLDGPGFLKRYDFEVLVFTKRPITEKIIKSTVNSDTINKSKELINVGNEKGTVKLELENPDTINKNQEIADDESEEDTENSELENMDDFNILQTPEKIIKIGKTVEKFIKAAKMVSEIFPSRKPRKHQQKNKVKLIKPVIKMKKLNNNNRNSRVEKKNNNNHNSRVEKKKEAIKHKHIKH